jgi:hypothetical protein
MLEIDQWATETENGSKTWVKGAAAATAGGTVIVLARRRRKRKKEAADREKGEEAARTVRGKALKVAGKAAAVAGPAASAIAAKAGPAAKAAGEKIAPVAKTAGEKVTEGLDRVSEDRKVRTYVFAGLAGAWLLFRLSEWRQLRKLNRNLEAA